MAKYSDVIESFAKALNAGEKIYWICQMIEESDDSDLASAIGRFNDLKQRFGETVGLMHGKMKEQEKAEIMQKFLVGEYKILVATTVVEVGVNVPDATIIAIEQAERFGLSQLHQLRGRVGRSDKKSYCILLYSVNATEQAKERLQVIKGTTDGFAIAAADMEARGGGNLVGVEQSGFADFTVANPFIDKDLIQIAVQEAKRIIVSYHIQELHNEIIQIIKMFGYTQEAEKLLQN
jgi:ATP-dependent DNA helicase RecG